MDSNAHRRQILLSLEPGNQPDWVRAEILEFTCRFLVGLVSGRGRTTIILFDTWQKGDATMNGYNFIAGRKGGTRRMKGMTLIELIVVAFIISTLSAIGYIGYQEFYYRAQVSEAIADIRNIDAKLHLYYTENVAFPPTLAEIGQNNRLDPWGNPYDYWPMTGDKNQKVRKDKNLHPLNTDFDLYSKGKDGNTNLALTAKASQDDIVRANDGKFVDLASKY
jgi:general secretion pathway protein G